EQGPLRGPGSEGSEGSARFQRAGSKGVVSPFRGDEFDTLPGSEIRKTSLRSLVCFPSPDRAVVKVLSKLAPSII
ncbi:hypothetical protein, partial [Dialister succinatiphilus]|uniref:hypothetical protein n=1 Tax=Dialister succinatiphilus TaxID=487173 RepID=UPI003FEDAD93